MFNHVVFKEEIVSSQLDLGNLELIARFARAVPVDLRLVGTYADRQMQHNPDLASHITYIINTSSNLLRQNPNTMKHRRYRHYYRHPRGLRPSAVPYYIPRRTEITVNCPSKPQTGKPLLLVLLIPPPFLFAHRPSCSSLGYSEFRIPSLGYSTTPVSFLSYLRFPETEASAGLNLILGNQGHQLQGQTVFPAIGYIAVAVKAAAALINNVN